jgi:hypothetical protein
MKSKILCMLGVWFACAASAEETRSTKDPESGKAEASIYAPNDVVNDGGGGESDPFASPAYGGYAALPRIPIARSNEKRKTLMIRVEIWEVGTREMAVALDGFDSPMAVENWRRERLKDKNSRLVHAPMQVIDEKSQAATESIVEEIYPTEYEPPEIPPDKVMEQVLAEKMPDSLNELIRSLTAGATSTAFETRNTGLTLETSVQPVTGESGCWDLALSVENVDLVRMKRFEPEALHIEMPVFSNFRTGGLQRLQESRWQMVSALARPNGTETKNEELTWVTLVRIDPAR